MTNPPFGAQNSATIEFNCSQCGRLLRSGAMYAGRQTKCPQCGEAQLIPGANKDDSPGAEPPVVFQPGSPPNFPSPSPPISSGSAANVGDVLDSGSIDSYSQSPSPPANVSPSQPPAIKPFGGESHAASLAPVSSPPQPLPNRQDTNRLPAVSPSEGVAGHNSAVKQLFDRIMEQIRKIYVGQDELVLGTLVAMFSGGHVLIESFPGLGKTLFVRALGRTLGLNFGRIQFTADLMPSDITGSPIFDMKQQEFRFRPGPVFTQLLLADEINRAPAKTHAALLEIMQEYHVTIDGHAHSIERPFLVLATQNPIESEGTYNLPEAQLDRFMLKLYVDYPSEGEEADILKMHSMQKDLDRRLEEELQTVSSSREILKTTQDCAAVRVDERLVDYINQVVRLTRQWPQFHMGASPRAGLALMQGARTLAAFRGRDYAVPDDVVELALPTLRHRVMLTAEAEVEGRHVDELLTELVRSVEVPRL